jgi:opacity protein-like surface antigen
MHERCVRAVLLRTVLRIALAGAVAGPARLPAQWAAKDAGEVSVFTGGAFGAAGTRPTVGGSTGVSASRYAIALVETSYIPLGGDLLAHHPAGPVSGSKLFDFNFAVHVRVPVKRRWEPYGLLGPALLFNPFRVQVILIDGTVAHRGFSDSKFGFEVGGGVRYYVHETWGIRAEHRSTISTRNFSRIQAGIFYQFANCCAPFRFH